MVTEGLRLVTGRVFIAASPKNIVAEATRLATGAVRPVTAS